MGDDFALFHRCFNGACLYLHGISLPGGKAYSYLRCVPRGDKTRFGTVNGDNGAYPARLGNEDRFGLLKGVFEQRGVRCRGEGVVQCNRDELYTAALCSRYWMLLSRLSSSRLDMLI